MYTWPRFAAGKFLARSESLKKHGAPPMCGRIATSKCWRWTGETSRTCSTPQIPQLGISCISLSSEGPRCRHSVSANDPKRTLETLVLEFFQSARVNGTIGVQALRGSHGDHENDCRSDGPDSTGDR